MTLTAAHAHAVRTHARRNRPVSARIPMTPRPPAASRPSASATARTKLSVRQHIQTVSKVRSNSWQKPEARPHQARDPDTFVGRTGLSLESAEGADVLLQLRVWLKKNASRVMTLFRKWDTDQNGEVSAVEFTAALQRLGLKVPGKEASQLFAEFDPDGSGAVDFRELNKALRRGVGQGTPRAAADFDEGDFQRG